MVALRWRLQVPAGYRSYLSLFLGSRAPLRRAVAGILVAMLMTLLEFVFIIFIIIMIMIMIIIIVIIVKIIRLAAFRRPSRRESPGLCA